DPALVAINTALAAINKGDTASARSTLVAALEKYPDNVGILGTLMQLEVREGQTDKAKEYLARAIQAQPSNGVLKQWDAKLRYDDPIEAVRHYLEDAVADEGLRAVATAVSLGAFANQQDAEAKRTEKSDAAASAKAHELAQRAREEL